MIKKQNDNLINLSKSAELIASLSGRTIDSTALRNQIVRGHWTFDAQKLGRDWYLEESDVKKYAKTYRGIKMGRPLKTN